MEVDILANRLRSETLCLRIMPEEKEIIKRKMQETKSRNYVDFIMKAISTHHTTNIDTRPLMKIGGELNRIGVNVNQIAKEVNTSKNLTESTARELLAVLYEIRDQVNEMREVVRKVLDIFIDAREGRIGGLHEDAPYKD